MRFPRLPAGFVAVAGPLALCAALTGCGGNPDPIYAQAVGFICPNHDDEAARAACAYHAPGEAETVSRYCYKTLADINCFDRPDPDRKNQQQGSSGY